jgi:hypothetical protein
MLLESGKNAEMLKYSAGNKDEVGKLFAVEFK